MSKLTLVRQTVPLSHTPGVGCAGRQYVAVQPDMLLHRVTNGSTSASPGCEPGDADVLLEAGGGNWVLVARPVPKTKTQAKAPEPEPEDDNPVLSPPLDLLDMSVAKLARAISSGDHDAHLDALLAAEQAGKTRSTAVQVLQDRIDEIGG